MTPNIVNAPNLLVNAGALSASGIAITSAVVADVTGTEITFDATTSGDISAGIFFVNFNFGATADPSDGWQEYVAGAVENQSITVDIAAYGGTVSSVVVAQVGYNPLAPGDDGYSAANDVLFSGLIVPVVVSAAIDNTSPAVGDTLTGEHGIIVGGSPMTLTQQWQRCDGAGANCVAIPGETATTYEVVSGDVGDTLKFQQTSTNSAGSDTATSAATAVVVAGYDPQAQAVIDQWKVTTPGLSTGWQDAINDLVVAAKANGYWTNADNFYVFAADVETNALLDWKAPTGTASTNVSSTAFTAKQGFTGDGTADYIDHNIAVNAGTNFLKDTNGRAFYLRSNPATGNQRTYGGWASSATARYGDVLAFSPRINGGNLGSATANGATGVRGFSRSSSVDVAIYHSGEVTPLVTAGADTSQNLVAGDHITLAGNNTQYGTAQMSFTWIGGALTQDIVDDMATDVGAFLTAVAGL